jgi:hypothetical protein
MRVGSLCGSALVEDDRLVSHVISIFGCADAAARHAGRSSSAAIDLTPGGALLGLVRVCILSLTGTCPGRSDVWPKSRGGSSRDSLPSSFAGFSV